MNEQQQQIVDTARSMIGARWRHRGRKAWAVDCIGIMVLSMESAGIKMRDRTDYGREPWNDGLQREMLEHFGEPVSDDWQAGDVAIVKWANMPAPSHVAIIADYPHGGLSLIHAHSSWGVAEHRLDEDWAAMIVEVYRPWAA